MVCHGGFNLDEATRRSWYNPEAVLKNLQTGMTFADIGSGEGFFSILATKKVGASGKVFAVDIDPSGIAKLKAKASAEGLTNINATVGKAEETVFCQGCVDIVFYSMVLHDFGNPKKVLQNAKEMVKPDGVVIDLDWKKEPMPFGPPAAIRFNEEHVMELMRSAGLTVANVEYAGPYHYIVVAKRS